MTYGTKSPVGRREMLAGCCCGLAWLLAPALREQGARSWRTMATGVTGKVGRAEVRSLVSMTQVFSDADNMLGGGHVRWALSTYLHSTVMPWLRADASPAVRRELLAAAAKLVYLRGFMCFDDEWHVTAQRCYLASRSLAAEAGDRVGQAIPLRALSVQAYLLGHGQQAADLAESALRTASSSVPMRTRSFLLGQLAMAAAATGDRPAAMIHLRETERALEQVDSSEGPVGVYHVASLAHQEAAVAACLGDRRSAIAALRVSISHRPEPERRSRAITMARLAELELAEGDVELACATWGRFLDDYPHLRSGRIDRALATLRSRTKLYQDNPAARALLRRATGMPRIQYRAFSSCGRFIVL